MAQVKYAVVWVPTHGGGPGPIVKQFELECNSKAANGFFLVNSEPDRWGEKGWYLFFEKDTS